MSAEDWIMGYEWEDEPEDVVYHLKRIEFETAKAYRVRVEGRDFDELFWIPKSQAVIQGQNLIVPAWLDARLDIQVDDKGDIH